MEQGEPCPDPPGAFKRPHSKYLYSVYGVLYGRDGRLTVLFGGFRPGQNEGALDMGLAYWGASVSTGWAEESAQALAGSPMDMAPPNHTNPNRTKPTPNPKMTEMCKTELTAVLQV